MKLYLDAVHGADAVIQITRGKISRMALVAFRANELPIFPTTGQLLQALNVLGLPQKKSRFPLAGYEDYILKTHALRPFNAMHIGVEMIYEWAGLKTVTDTSTLSQVPTQIFPKDHNPLYVKYTVGTAPNQYTVKKVLTLNQMLPMRHIIVQATVDYMASGDVINAFPSVNSVAWSGLPPGYWLYSGIEGYTDDDGTTYTYTATFSTKMKEDWSQLGFMEDDNGQPIAIPEADVKTLRDKPYNYAQDSTVNGLLKVGMLPMVNFFDVLGL